MQITRTHCEFRADELDPLGLGVDDVELHGEPVHDEIILAVFLHVDAGLRVHLGREMRNMVKRRDGNGIGNATDSFWSFPTPTTLRALGELLDVMSAKFSDFLTPSLPLSAIGTDLY